MRALVLCLLLSQVASAQPNDAFIKQKMDEAGIMGFGAAVIVDDKVVWTKGYGFADKRRGVPFTPNTVMNIASITKTFTGVALMRAVQDGKLSLDEDINKYLPFKVVNPHLPNAKITLRHIATHTSGISDRPSVYSDTYHFDDKPEPLGEFLKDYFVPGGKHYAKENFLDKKPGAVREYSNIAAGLAGYIVELAVGEKLETYAKKHIFTPLRMNDTGWSLAAIDRSNHTKQFVSQKGLIIPIGWYEGTTYPDGGIRTSIADLSKFFIALLNDGECEGTRILDKNIAAEMTRFQFTADNKPENEDIAEYNSGIFWRTKFNATRVGHGGSDPGVQTEMLATLDKKVGVIVFSNTSLSSQDMIAHFYPIVNDLFKYGESLRAAK